MRKIFNVLLNPKVIIILVILCTILHGAHLYTCLVIENYQVSNLLNNIFFPLKNLVNICAVIAIVKLIFDKTIKRDDKIKTIGIIISAFIVKWAILSLAFHAYI